MTCKNKPLVHSRMQRISKKQKKCSIVTIYPLASPHYLNLLYQLVAIRSSSVFSHLRPGEFHIALQTQKTQHTQLRGWKKRRTNKHRLGLAPSTRREKFVTLFCGFLLAITSMYPSEIPTQPPGTLTHPLMWLTWLLSSQVPTSHLAVAFL